MSGVPQIQDLINALGWTLIHFLWQGLGIAFVFWLVCRFTESKNSLLRYWSGMLAFLATAVVPIATFIFYWNSMSGVVGGQAYAAPIMPVSGELSFSAMQLLRAAMEPALPLVVILWAVGVVILSARAFLGWVGAHRLVRLDTREVSGSLQEIFRGLMASLEIQQAVRVLRSARVSVPTVVGWLKPVILIPVAVINRLPEDQLEMIIAHELGHIRRYDYLFNLLQVVIETLFFYHPAIRWMSKQVRQEREHCCDDLVLAQRDQPVLYARALANLEIMRDDPLPAMVLAASGGDLIQRLRRIARQDLPCNQTGFAQLAVMIGVATLVSVSARQGLDVSNHFLDASTFSTKTAVYELDSMARSRSAWVQGISEFSRLTVESERATALAISQKSDQSKAPVMTVVSNPGASQEHTNEPGFGEVMPARIAVQDKPMFSPAAPVTFGTDIRTGEFTEELVLLLSSSTMPSKTRHEPVLSDTGLQNRIAVQFEITPETVISPIYPFKARRKHIDGYVRLEFFVDQSGRAKDIRVVEAQPAEMFEKSAIKALEKWVFKVNGDHSENKRLFQNFDFDMEDRGQKVSKRERRCEIAGSRICGMKVYN